MLVTLSLVGFPLLAAILVLFARKQWQFTAVVIPSSIIIMVLSVVVVAQNFSVPFVADLSHYEWIHYGIIILEVLIAGFIIYSGIRNKSFLVTLFALVQICLVLWFEFTAGKEIHVSQTIYMDKLSLIMILIIGIVGSLICIYSVDYMREYHHHHTEYKDRRGFFFAVLFVFLTAMFMLVICNNMSYMLLFWEITSLCSFLLIGYTKTEEATRNSFLALTINVFGGLLFTIGIVVLGVVYGVGDFNSLLKMDPQSPVVMLVVFLLAVAGLTKSAQMPFHKWLLGAMVAPSPTSAMLHSSTMVKAGVFLIIRLAPMLGLNAVGIVITLVGGITFFITAILAVSQSDAKKILAYSTISNLGLIVACAGIGTAESLWAAIMLIIFHAIAKALLFLAVGSTEHQVGSRNVEDMDGLVTVSTPLTMMLVVGIAGMFLAPFGMLISKWAAMKAFVDSGNMLIVLLIAFGSTITLFFWTKWLGKLIANAHRTNNTDYRMRLDEKASLYSLAALVVIVCAIFPVISNAFVAPYIEGNLGIAFSSPINDSNTIIIIMMMLMLFLLPLVLIPLYRKHKVKPSSIYMAGENAGDDENFIGSMGKVQHLELRNWYMQSIINDKRVSQIGIAICGTILLIGFCTMIGGRFI